MWDYKKAKTVIFDKYERMEQKLQISATKSNFKSSK